MPMVGSQFVMSINMSSCFAGHQLNKFVIELHCFMSYVTTTCNSSFPSKIISADAKELTTKATTVVTKHIVVSTRPFLTWRYFFRSFPCHVTKQTYQVWLFPVEGMKYCVMLRSLSLVSLCSSVVLQLQPAVVLQLQPADCTSSKYQSLKHAKDCLTPLKNFTQQHGSNKKLTNISTESYKFTNMKANISSHRGSKQVHGF